MSLVLPIRFRSVSSADAKLILTLTGKRPVSNNASPFVVSSLLTLPATRGSISQADEPSGLDTQGTKREKRSKGKGRQQEKEIAFRRGPNREESRSSQLNFGNFATAEVEPRVSPEAPIPQTVPPPQASPAIKETPPKTPTLERAEPVAAPGSASPTPISTPVAPSTPPRASQKEEVPLIQESASTEAAPVPPKTPPPATSTPAAPKVPVKSWAALLRTGGKAVTPGKAGSTPSVTSSAMSPMQSGMTSPTGSNATLPPSSAVYTPSTTPGTPGTPMMSSQVLPPGPPAPRGVIPSSAGGYAAAAANGVNSPGGGGQGVNGSPAWGASGRFTYEDMGRLLLEGVLDNKSAIIKANHAPRGLINTGNMCFANSILQVLAYCVPFSGLFEELGKRVNADLGRRTPLIEAM